MEGDPHSIIEGMLIGGYAIGSDTGYIFIKGESDLSIERMTYALKQAADYGLIGKNILGTDFSFNLSIRVGGGAYVEGDASGLQCSLEGERAMPRVTFYRSVERGLWDKPTSINNVETFASIPTIIEKGGAWYAEFGTEQSRGTKVFSLSGDITRPGMVEIPLGLTLRQLVYDIGGGPALGKKVKAVQCGGPSGGCVPASMLDLPITLEAFWGIEGTMGSGGMVVMDEDTCMVDVVKELSAFNMSESCGKCTPCREGTLRIFETLEKITEGYGEPEDIRKLEELGPVMEQASICGLGQGAPVPVLKSLQYFREEFETHINNKECPARKCLALVPE